MMCSKMNDTKEAIFTLLALGALMVWWMWHTNNMPDISTKKVIVDGYEYTCGRVWINEDYLTCDGIEVQISAETEYTIRREAE